MGLILLLAMALISSWSSPPHNLDNLQWKNRVLLIFARASNDPQLESQTTLIEKNSAAFEDRDLIVFTVPPSDPLRKHFHVPDHAFEIILIGKDGTEKHRYSSVASPEDIFKLIDSMPMRRAGGR